MSRNGSSLADQMVWDSLPEDTQKAVTRIFRDRANGDYDYRSVDCWCQNAGESSEDSFRDACSEDFAEEVADACSKMEWAMAALSTPELRVTPEWGRLLAVLEYLENL